MDRIVLIGYRGSGKTSVGRRLARALKVRFIDTDTLIEKRAGKSIPKIFDEDGENTFRKYEREAIADLPGEDAVIGTGGGAVLDPENVRLLRAQSTIFLLLAPADTLGKRISGSSRPSLTALAPDEEIRALLKQRMPAYLRAADFCIDSGPSVFRTCQAILHTIQQGSAENAAMDQILAFLRQTSIPRDELTDLERVLSDPHRRLTRLCAIIGNPSLHSRSPVLYNHLFSHFKLNFYYTRVEWPDLPAIIDMVRAIGMRGLSVTIPFKEEILPHIDELDLHARAIGAVNTVVRCGGHLHGYNTDWVGIFRPLENLKHGERAVVFGAGGAAAAATYALQHLGMEVTILNRNPERARMLAQRFGCSSGPLTGYAGLDPDVIINATPVGMGRSGGTLLSRDDLHPGMIVFDLVYTPPETMLINEATAAGCTAIPGEEMFVHQACEQFKIFTGITVSPDTVRRMMQ